MSAFNNATIISLGEFVLTEHTRGAQDSLSDTRRSIIQQELNRQRDHRGVSEDRARLPWVQK